MAEQLFDDGSAPYGYTASGRPRQQPTREQKRRKALEDAGARTPTDVVGAPHGMTNRGVARASPKRAATPGQLAALEKAREAKTAAQKARADVMRGAVGEEEYERMVCGRSSGATLRRALDKNVSLREEKLRNEMEAKMAALEARLELLTVAETPAQPPAPTPAPSPSPAVITPTPRKVTPAPPPRIETPRMYSSDCDFDFS